MKITCKVKFKKKELKKTVVYVSGKITDNPNYKEEFAAAEEKLKKHGYLVINPVFCGTATEKATKKYLYREPRYEEYMRTCIVCMFFCGAIYQLPNWQDSNGAKLEKQIAEAIGMKFVKDEDLIEGGNK